VRIVGANVAIGFWLLGGPLVAADSLGLRHAEEVNATELIVASCKELDRFRHLKGCYKSVGAGYRGHNLSSHFFDLEVALVRNTKVESAEVSRGSHKFHRNLIVLVEAEHADLVFALSLHALNCLHEQKNVLFRLQHGRTNFLVFCKRLNFVE